MTAPTHVVGGIAALAFFDLLFPAYRLNFPLVLWGSLFSLLPDIDNPRSFIGRILFFISGPFERRFGHRTFTHSFLALILVAGCTYLAFYLQTNSYTRPLVWSFTFSLAYFSHLLFDSMTKQGILAYWPSRLWGVIPKKSSWRIQTGSRIELVYFFIFLALSLTFLPIGQSGLISGFNRLFQPGASEVRLQELEHKKATAAHGFTEEQIDSLLRAGAIDPKQANDMKAKLRDVELQEEKFKREQGIFND
jgi:inner membrane protein